MLLSDVAAATPVLDDRRPPRRLPVGVGLAIAAGASLSLWGVIVLGLKALLA